jgi:hypothetical protein
MIAQKNSEKMFFPQNILSAKRILNFEAVSPS